MKSIIITGANGQLGRCFRVINESFGQLDLHFLPRKTLDITAPDQAVLDSYHPDFVINCGAYTAVDKAESEIDLAMHINGSGLADLASYCNARKIPLLHYSSDYVYHNEQTAPLRENDKCTPKGVYGKSKLEGEKVIAGHTPLHIILRVSWLYSPFQNNFMKTMLRLFKNKECLNIVNDQMGCPTSGLQLASDSLRIVNNYFTSPYDFAFGIYNYTHSGFLSWYDFATAIKLCIGATTKLNPIPSSSYPTPAKRPLQSRLHIDRVISAFNLQPINWKDCLWENLQHSSTKAYIETL